MPIPPTSLNDRGKNPLTAVNSATAVAAAAVGSRLSRMPRPDRQDSTVDKFHRQLS